MESMSEIAIPHHHSQSPSLLRRFAILNYDGLLLIAVSMAYGMIYIGISKLVFLVDADRATGTLFQLGWLLTLFGFFYYFWTHEGQTTGMRAWRVKIIDANGNTPTTIQCILRFTLAAIGWALFFSYFFSDQKNLLHDKWSNTQLIMLEKSKK
jgi:uncharacterized RDD family membrane protein YckC